ncbi:MAG TPA: amino acid permease, partial [Cytophagales bacterium]|nr:amino acid permease [Cytophagales bacterium]
MNQSIKKIDLATCVSVIISSMIGVGVYTSLGYQVLGLSSVFAILCLWFFGGIMALCGALTYGELAARYPRSGGEYNFLSEIYHPAIGFISGWISSTVGFAGPTAAAALVFANYFNKIFGLDLSNSTMATLLIVLITLLNILSFNVGSKVQKVITAANILLITTIIVYGLFQTPSETFSFSATAEDLKQINTDGFGISLVYVSFAFSGWNAITYIINDVDNPKVNVPRSLIIASMVVMVLYMCLNFVFLYTTPMHVLKSELCDGCTGYVAGT